MSLKHAKAMKRFGTRYGRTIREKVGLIEVEQRKLHKCPYCNNNKVKRVSTGIWKCGKCNAKFTSKAYTVEKAPSIKASV